MAADGGTRPGLVLQPGFVTFEPLRIAQAQVFVADALAAREQRVGELLDVHAGVTVHVLKPLGGVARGVLDLQHLHAAACLVAFQHFLHRFAAPSRIAEFVGQVDRVFQRELGAAADGEVGRVGRVAHEHDGRGLAGNVLPVHPGLADHARKADPVGRAAQVFGVADEGVAIEVSREQLFAESHTFLLTHVFKAVGLPHIFRRFDDEGRGLIVKLVGVGLKPAVFGLFECKREGVKGLPGAEPDEAAFARVDVGPVSGFVARADAAVEAVAGDHEVGVVLLSERLVVGHVGFEHQIHTQRQATFLQDVEQALAADADEAVTGGAHAAVFVEDFDVVPVVEGVGHLLRRLRVGALQVLQRLVRKHHPPAKGVERPVALDHRDLQVRVAALHEQAEIEARRAAADAQDAPQRWKWGVHA
ncbi:hypothetical protein Y695_02702 [Hydrogenophaga sp. T4]|nr:hypothetical protein Y695_02702 [Hydrogenophaga sp. T4]